MSTNRYIATGHRAITAETMQDAAEAFALRKARKVFGRSARVAALCSHAWSWDNSMGEWSAFIGYRSGSRETTGRNVRFTIWKD
jgi:hypothetical protein